MSCSHGMPSPKSCLDCMEEGNVEPPRWKIIKVLAAHYPGSCRDCGGDFVVGESIKYWQKEDIDSAYTHINCGLT